jgi:hypothetical protein
MGHLALRLEKQITGGNDRKKGNGRGKGSGRTEYSPAAKDDSRDEGLSLPGEG